MKLHLFIAALLFAAPAGAQMSVTTIGADDAAMCYQRANDDMATDTEPCARALRDSSTTRRDRMKTLVNRGIIHNRNGALTQAFADFDAALEIDSDLAEAYLNRGNSWFLTGEYEHALRDYEHALALDVAKPWAAWYNIGLVHDARKDSDKAREAYQKALELNSDFTLARQKLENR
jgi:tetratricopeptide (TPR) repeat protein